MQPPAFRQEVYALQPGKAGSGAQSWGYEVVQVRSRTTDPVQRARWRPVIGVVASVAGPGLHVAGSGRRHDTGLSRILKAANVKVDPSYGSWTTALPAPPYIPRCGRRARLPPSP